MGSSLSSKIQPLDCDDINNVEADVLEDIDRWDEFTIESPCDNMNDGGTIELQQQQNEQRISSTGERSGDIPCKTVDTEQFFCDAKEFVKDAHVEDIFNTPDIKLMRSRVRDAGEVLLRYDEFDESDDAYVCRAVMANALFSLVRVLYSSGLMDEALWNAKLALSLVQMNIYGIDILNKLTAWIIAAEDIEGFKSRTEWARKESERESNPSDLYNSTYVSLLYDLACAYYTLGDLSEAKACIDIAKPRAANNHNIPYIHEQLKALLVTILTP